MDSRIVATLQTILQKPGNLQDLGQGGEIEIAQMQLQLLTTAFNLLIRWFRWQNKKLKGFILVALEVFTTNIQYYLHLFIQLYLG